MGPRPLRLTCPRKRAPTSGPVDPSIHSHSSVSGLKRPVLVTSLTSAQTRSGGASTWTVTESVGIPPRLRRHPVDHVSARLAPVVLGRPQVVVEDAQRVVRAAGDDTGVEIDRVPLALGLTTTG